MADNSKQPLTDRQKEVLDLIEERIDSWGYAPTLKEVAEYFEISVGSSQALVNQLIDKKYLKRIPHKERGLVVL